MLPVMRARCFVALTCLCAHLATFAGNALAQSDEQRTVARELATQGISACREQRWEAAIDYLTRAESLFHAPAHLLYLGRAHAGLGQLVRAREFYLRLVHESLPSSASPAFFEAQDKAKSELEALEKRVARVQVLVDGEEAKAATVTLDGKPLLAQAIGLMTPVDPGEHRFLATSAHNRSQVLAITLADGEQRVVTLKLESAAAAASTAPVNESPQAPGAAPVARGATQKPSAADTDEQKPRSKWMKPAAIAALAVGGAGLGGGIYFGLQTRSKDSEADGLEKQCGSGCLTSDPLAQRITALDEESRTAKTWSIVGFSVAGVGIATGVTLWLLDSGSAERQAKQLRVRVAGNAGPRGAALRVLGEF